MRSVLAAAVVLVVVLVATAGGVSQVEPPDEGTVLGSPSLTVVATDNAFEWGDRRELVVTIANAGNLVRAGPERFEERVTTARSVELSVATERLSPPLDGRLDVESGRVLLGELPESTARPVTLSVGVPQSIPPGVYRLPLRIEYEYTSFVRFGPTEPLYNDADREVVETVTFVVLDRPRLALSAVQTTDVTPGTTGVFRFTVENTGTQPARDVGLTLSTSGGAVGFGGEPFRQSTLGVFLGDLEPGASETVAVTASAAAATAPGAYLVAMTARYTTVDGFEREQTDLRAGLRVESDAETNATTTQGAPATRSSNQRPSVARPLRASGNRPRLATPLGDPGVTTASLPSETLDFEALAPLLLVANDSESTTAGERAQLVTRRFE